MYVLIGDKSGIVSHRHVAHSMRHIFVAPCYLAMSGSLFDSEKLSDKCWSFGVSGIGNLTTEHNPVDFELLHFILRNRSASHDVATVIVSFLEPQCYVASVKFLDRQCQRFPSMSHLMPPVGMMQTLIRANSSINEEIMLDPDSIDLSFAHLCGASGGYPQEYVDFIHKIKHQQVLTNAPELRSWVPEIQKPMPPLRRMPYFTHQIVLSTKRRAKMRMKRLKRKWHNLGIQMSTPF